MNGGHAKQMTWTHAVWSGVGKLALAATLKALALGILLFSTVPIQAAFVGDYSLGNFTLINDNANGSWMSPDGNETLVITGGNNGSGFYGSTHLVLPALDTVRVSFHYSYETMDEYPLYDSGGYIARGQFRNLSFAAHEGDRAFIVAVGENFGFGVETADNMGGPAVLTISQFAATPVPEPGTASTIAVAAAAYAAYRLRLYRRRPD